MLGEEKESQTRSTPRPEIEPGLSVLEMSVLPTQLLKSDTKLIDDRLYSAAKLALHVEHSMLMI